MLPASLPSLPSPSSLRSPSPPSLSEPLWRGSVQRRLAEKQEESMSPALLDVCAPTSREGNESENGGGAPRASEEVLTSGQGVGRQEQSVSSRRRRRAAPVVDTNEEPQDEDAAAENQGRMSSAAAKRGIGTKSKRKPADIESDDGSVDNLPTSKTVHQLPEKRPRWRLRVKPFVDIRSRLLSEDELRARLVVPELIPTPEQLPAWYNFYRVWFERLAVAMSKTQWRARSLGRGVQEINWSLRGIANSLLAINQFREIRKALPGCSDTALEWRAVNAQERLESGLRQALINVLGTEISFCVEQLEAELLRIAIGASMGVHRAAVKRRREAAFVGVDTTDPFSALLVNYASDLPWRLMGRIPLEELSGWLAREEDISNQIPEDSLFKRAVQAEIERTTEVTEDSQDTLPPGRGKVHIRWKEFSHSETAAPVFTEFLSEAGVRDGFVRYDAAFCVCTQTESLEAPEISHAEYVGVGAPYNSPRKPPFVAGILPNAGVSFVEEG
ncbi:hypothetical protein TGVAND_362760 [Toxoplasma gondii VAND]|uniref:Uncharacterized protein n=3 Tax=Toxoplasma gondii TaxID=5811 RepID=A0A086Q9Z4_TOXGO|nr:hypothetical protein TGVAND_362760 [Toxoplasma gondii VAND]KFH09426.1 hypothetical protein TGMAS_362760 [Toxoplasma gondii MAS]PUA86059.1 hypothetical protein TGBR9_362760 [Toxoplasma gondii TgCATBr9]